jgi:hypothetical protein
MMRWAGFVGSVVVVTVALVSGCKEKTTHITVVQPERTVVREVPMPAEPAPAPEPPPAVEAPAPVYAEPAPAPVYAEPAAPVVVAPAPVVIAPAPVVVEPVVTPAVSVGFFVERLGHHGRWATVATYGQVWVPGGVAVGWQPYSLGHWAYTDAYGWTWVSDEPWGWATYHYGRWVYLEPQGWVWVPGTVWAPAWVVWRSGGGYVGWAPMPPQAIVGPVVSSSTEVNINININIEKHIRPNHWVFVEERHVLEPVHAHIVVAKRSDWIINVTRPSTHFVESHGRIINRSLVVRDVERATGRQVRPMRIREVDAAAASDTRTAVKGDEIVMPRARLRPMDTARTSGATPAGTRTPAGRRGADNAVQPTAPVRGGVQPRVQDATKAAPTPAAGSPVVRQPAVAIPRPAATGSGVNRATDIRPKDTIPVEPARKLPASSTPRPEAATRDVVHQPAPKVPATSVPTRTPVERRPQLEPRPVPVEKPAEVSRNTSNVKATPVRPPTPVPSAVHNADVSKQAPAAREGREVVVDRPNTRRAQSEPAPTIGQPAPDRDRAPTVRREAPTPGKAAVKDAAQAPKTVEPRRGEASREEAGRTAAGDRTKSAAERQKQHEEKQGD